MSEVDNGISGWWELYYHSASDYASVVDTIFFKGDGTGFTHSYFSYSQNTKVIFQSNFTWHIENDVDLIVIHQGNDGTTRDHFVFTITQLDENVLVYDYYWPGMGNVTFIYTRTSR